MSKHHAMAVIKGDKTYSYLILYVNEHINIQEANLERPIYSVIFRPIFPANLTNLQGKEIIIYIFYVLFHAKNGKITVRPSRARILKPVWSARIDSKELILPAYTAWWACTRTLFLLGS
jgi:hypothetical protein